MSQSRDPVVLRIRDFVSGCRATYNGAFPAPQVGSIVRLRDSRDRECDAFVRGVARVPHDPRGSHWEIDVEPIRGTHCLAKAGESMPITEAAEASGDPKVLKAIPTWLRWRVGRKVGRTIYAQMAPEPSDDDQLIGVMDTPALAEEAVRSHNSILRNVQVLEAEDAERR